MLSRILKNNKENSLLLSELEESLIPYSEFGNDQEATDGAQRNCEYEKKGQTRLIFGFTTALIGVGTLCTGFFAVPAAAQIILMCLGGFFSLLSIGSAGLLCKMSYQDYKKNSALSTMSTLYSYTSREFSIKTDITELSTIKDEDECYESDNEVSYHNNVAL